MTLYDGDFQKAASAHLHVAVDLFDLNRFRARHYASRNNFYRLCAVAVDIENKIVCRKFSDVNGVEDVCRQIALRGVEKRFSVLGNYFPVLYDELCVEIFQIVNGDKIGGVERRDSAPEL